MRFEQLRLLAFGPFTNEVLDLRGGAPGGLHVIYGPNEAGKSTSLRAVVNFLFGMPRRSPDAHLHPSARLAVGAVISSSGKSLELTRLKRNQENLVDVNGAAVAEGVLAEMLGHLDQASFCTRFGLDQAELEKGAEALLGGSEQGLFAAGTAGADVRRVLNELESQAADLFLSRGKLPMLNRHNAEYEQALMEARRAERPAEKWLAQKRSHEQACAHVLDLEARRAQVRVELRRLQRLKAVFSDLLEWQAAEQRLVALATVPDLPGDASQERVQASAELMESQAVAARIAQDLAKFEQELEQLSKPSPLADVDDEQLQLAARVGTAISARKDLPKRKSALSEQCALLGRLLAELGREAADVELLTAREVLSGADNTAHVHRLIAQHSGLRTSLAAAEARVERLGTAVSEQGEHAPTDVAFLLAALEGQMAEAKLAQAVAVEVGQLEKMHLKLATRLEYLRAHLHCGAPWQLLAEQLPKVETFREMIAAQQAAEEEYLRCRGVEDMLEKRRKAVIERLEQEDNIPSMAPLHALRLARDAAIHDFTGDSPSEKEQLLSLVHEVDSAADQLLENADKVYAHAALERERDDLAQQVHVATELTERGRALLRERWRAFEDLASALGAAPPRSLSLAQAWHDELCELVTVATEHQAIFLELQRAGERVSKAEAKLRSCLAESGAEFPGLAELGLAGLVSLLETVIRRAVKEQERKSQLALQRKRTLLEKEQAEAELAQARHALELWTRAWGQALGPLGLDGQTSVERVQEVLATLSRIEKIVETATTLENRISGMQRDTDALERDISPYVERYLPAGSRHQEVVDQAAQLLEAVRLARRNRDEWLRVQALVQERQATLRDTQTRSEIARQRLKSMMLLARVDDEQGLVEVEQFAMEKRQLRARVQELSERIRVSSDGAPMEELLAEAAQWGGAVRRLIVRIDDLEQEGAELDEQLRQAQSEAESIRLGLLTYGTEDVAMARQVVSERAAAARSALRKYLVTTAAHTMLKEQMVRYAARFSGPIAERASELFRRITLGKYSRLAVGIGERTLRCVRDGQQVEVSELSRGARAQLYFVLRLASLEHYFAAHPKVPLVFDDLFVDFDDDRTTVAFELLAELAQDVQVLYFTHLARDVEKAHDAVPKERLFTHAIGVK